MKIIAEMRNDSRYAHIYNALKTKWLELDRLHDILCGQKPKTPPKSTAAPARKNDNAVTARPSTNLIKGKHKMFGKYEIAPAKKQDEARLKYDVYLEYQNRGCVTLLQLLETLKCDQKYATLKDKLTEPNAKRWFAIIKEAPMRKMEPLDALVDSRGKHRKGDYKIPAHIQEFIINHLLDKNTQWKAKTIARDAVKYFGAEAPSSSTVGRFIRDWKARNKMEAAFIVSPSKAKSIYMPAQGNASEKATHVNHYWELDSTPADVMTKDGKRCAILGLVDVFSRRCVFAVEETSNAYSISRLLRKGVLTLGVPETVITDNGRDYTSNHFLGVCALYHINHRSVEPYSGDQKPHIERLFRTLSHELFEELPGYVGHNVAERQAIRDREDFPKQLEAQKKWREEQRLGKDGAEKLTIKKNNKGLIVEVAFTMQELQMLVDAYVTEIYEKRIHRGEGMMVSPLEKWEQSPMPPAMIDDERKLDLLLMKPEIKLVHKDGIHLDKHLYGGVELVPYIGSRVFVLCPPELSEIFVYNDNMDFVGRAIDPTALGLSREMHANAKREGKRLFRNFEKTREEATEYTKKYSSALLDKVLPPKQAEVIDALVTDAPPRIHQSAGLIAMQQSYAAANNKPTEKEETELNDDGRPLFRSAHEKIAYLIKIGEANWTEDDRALTEKFPTLYNEALRSAA